MCAVRKIRGDSAIDKFGFLIAIDDVDPYTQFVEDLGGKRCPII
jgi:hypothetical protein